MAWRGLVFVQLACMLFRQVSGSYPFKPLPPTHPSPAQPRVADAGVCWHAALKYSTGDKRGQTFSANALCVVSSVLDRDEQPNLLSNMLCGTQSTAMLFYVLPMLIDGAVTPYFSLIFFKL